MQPFVTFCIFARSFLAFISPDDDAIFDSDFLDGIKRRSSGSLLLHFARVCDRCTEQSADVNASALPLR
jgi:hypothetical protein